MKILEGLGVDEYYQTISTWMKIMDEKAKQYEGGEKQISSDGGQQRKRLKGR